MLILTRKVGETIMIGDDIKVIVLEVNGKQVRIGTTAPKEIQVHRQEVYNRIQNDRIDRGLAIDELVLNVSFLGQLNGGHQ